MGLSFSGALTPTGRTTTRANKAPTWSSTGNLGQTLGNKPFTANLLGTDPDGTTVKYGIYDGGVLPTGISLNAETGILSGTPVNNPGVKTFPIYVTDGVDVIPQTFTLEIQNATPAWATLAGSLGTINENTSFSISLSASDENLDTLTFTKTAGTLPSGLTLASDGTISGTTGQVNQTTVYNFTVQVNDGATGLSSRAFSITVNNNINEPPVWSTAAGSLGILNEQTDFSYNLSVTDPDLDDTITYGVSSGTLPIGLSLNTATGVISGNTGVATGNVTYDFMISAQDGHNPVIYRAFSITVLNNVNEPPVWTTAAGLIGTFNQNASINFSFVATDQNGDGITYSITSGALPTGLSLSNAGALTGSTSQTGTFNFTITATDINSGTTARAFSLVSQSAGDQYWGNVSMYLPLISNSNDFFGRTITNTGTAFNGTASEGGTCANFTSTNHLAVGNPTTLSFPGDFTIECFAKPTAKIATNNYAQYAMYTNNAGYTNSFYFGYLRSDPNFGPYMGFHTSTGANIDQYFNIPSFNFSVWHHFAIVRSGTTLMYFHDGVLMNSWTGVTQTLSFQNTCMIGNDGSSYTEPMNGYMEHFRFTNGVARYTSAFTVPSAPFQTGPVWTTTAGYITSGSISNSYSSTVAATNAVSYSVESGSLPSGVTLNSSTGVISGTPTNAGTFTITIRATASSGSYVDRQFNIYIVNDQYYPNVSLLAHLENNVTDARGSSTLTNNGGTFNSTAKFGSYGLRFASSPAQSLNVTPNTGFDFTGDYTIEIWAYPTSKAVTNDYATWLFGTGTAPSTNYFKSYLLRTDPNYKFHLGGSVFGSATIDANIAWEPNAWHHYAICRSGTTTRLFYDGNIVGSSTSMNQSITISGQSLFRFANDGYNSSPGVTDNFIGSLDEIRITKGVARYTANFTIPSSAFPS
jgi:hypothetical protein